MTSVATIRIPNFPAADALATRSPSIMKKFTAADFKMLAGSPDRRSAGNRSPKLPTFSTIPFFRNAPAFFYTIDLVDMSFVDVSEGVENIIGYSVSECMANGPDWFFSLYLHEDLSRLKALYKALFKFYYTLPVNERTDFKYRWEARATTKDGKVVWLLHQGAIVDVDSSGRPLIAFDSMSDITDFKKDNCMQLSMFTGQGRSRSNVFFPVEANAQFSDREIEILYWLALGFSSKEIAEKLSISVHTVDTHRRNMLKKAGQADTVKLLWYARNNGLIPSVPSGKNDRS